MRSTTILLPVLATLASCVSPDALAPTQPPSPGWTSTAGTEAIPEAEIEGPPPARSAADVREVADLEQAFEYAARIIAPSVVSIINEKEAEPGLLSRRHRRERRREIQGLGSGVIIDDTGYILTNNHVIEGADTLKVKLHDNREVRGELVGTDEKTDLAVIKIEARGLRAAHLSEDDDGLRVGQWVLAVGSPFGLSRTVTAGIVSATGRGSLGLTDYGDFIQTDAAINRGNSGGPLIDLEGRVVGINTAILSPTGGSNGVGFAIPSPLATVVKDQLIDRGVVQRGWLGVIPGELTPALARSFGYEGRGVLVNDVDVMGPGHKAGIRSGDIVTNFDGEPVEAVGDFRNRVAQTQPGVEVTLELWHAGRSRERRVVLALLPGSARESLPRPKTRPHLSSDQRLGLALVDLDESSRRILGLGRTAGALVRTVEPGSIAEDAGLLAGDVLIRVDQHPATSAAEAHRLLTEADLDQGVRIRVQRDEFGYFMVLQRRSEG